MILRSAYFSDFKSGPTVLFWGGADDMGRLAKILKASAASSASLRLETLIEAADGRSIELKTTRRAKGMQVVEDRFGSRHLEWQLDSETMKHFADLVEFLAECVRPGHQYLESQVPNEITVMASAGEYPADLRPD